MTLYNVTGTFSNSLPLSGTIDISGSTINEMNLHLAGLTFNSIYLDYHEANWWTVTGQPQGAPHLSDYLILKFFSPLDLTTFTQAEIFSGAAVHNDFTTYPALTTYYGLGLTGTICPLEGCVPFFVPPVGVPGPVAGSGLVTVLVFAFLLRKFQQQDTRS